MSERWDVYVEGARRDPLECVHELMGLFGIDEPEARRILEQAPVRVKPGVTREEAASYEDALRLAGLRVRLRPAESASPALPAPPPPEAETEPWPFWQRRGFVAAALVVGLVVFYLALRPSTRAGLTAVEHGDGGDGDPTVLLLHGYGGSAGDMERVAEHLTGALPGLRVIALEAPHDVGLGGRAWWFRDPQRPQTARILREALAEVIEDGTPPERIVCAGYSQGAAAADELARSHPGVAGAALIGGFYPRDAPPPAPRVFVAHGDNDPVVGFSAAERAAERWGETAQVHMVRHHGGHRIVDPVLDALVAWLRALFG